MRIPPTTLRSKKSSPSSTCTGERARRYGSVRSVGVGPGAGEGGGDEARARHRRPPGWVPTLWDRRSVGLRRPAARRSGRWSGQFSRPPQAAGRRSKRTWVSVWEPTVTSPVETASARADRLECGAVSRERSAAFDEVGRHVQGCGDPVSDQNGKRLLDEVGRAVVEGDDHRAGPRRWRPGRRSPPRRGRRHLGPRPTGPLVLRRAIRADHARCRAASDSVIAEDDESTLGPAHHVIRGRRPLEGAAPDLFHRRRSPHACHHARRLPTGRPDTP